MAAWQPVTFAAKIGAWNTRKGSSPSTAVDVGELPQREDGLVPAARELAREGEESHQVAIVATELPSEKDARHARC